MSTSNNPICFAALIWHAEILLWCELETAKFTYTFRETNLNVLRVTHIIFKMHSAVLLFLQQNYRKWKISIGVSRLARAPSVD